LNGIEAVHGRVQDRNVLDRFSGQFDVVTARAFSDLGRLLSLSYPFLSKGGTVLAMRAESAEPHVNGVPYAEQAHYFLARDVSFFIPFSSYKRRVLLFTKRD
jgi:16S rRNA (guanine527-N7)-methyltransferase